MNIIKKDIHQIQIEFGKWPKAKRIVLISILSSIGAIFQSAGGFLPGVGYLISPLASAPIMLCTIFSIPLGLASYVSTALLLLILQPAELIIFPFTTGLLGLFIGISFNLFQKKSSHILSGSAGLVLGICILLYGVKFPVLGPAFSRPFNIAMIGLIFIFSAFYSWIWVVLCTRLIKRIRELYFRNLPDDTRLK
ncbi:hypothetical protein ACFFHH_15495 [Cytobacillus solani]|uniref:Uncharacterized protein n=1 Tax=Cytobacillus solani TaxID=1637975 RepID=A0A0Q3VQW2_9BACI|nr:hypothetical protein [Cytobacillus solani]KOP78795.1 hypothetical protein AMS60_18235 [Bacillus sp. FJAT-21945]KQL27551.1 hypothetical protein AN957_01030 [Cytobacillus solani]USK55257.1 hypothetical protein LIS82_01195 [Cytobacillus solani]